MTLQQANQEVANKLKTVGIKKVNITCVGNSISSGYSMLHKIKPLLEHNESLSKDFMEEGLSLSKYHFARAQDNSDAKIYRWLEENNTLSDIYQMNRRDYEGSPQSMPIAKDKAGNAIGITEEELESYYPKNSNDNPHFQDVVNPNYQTANIIIYNGATGSFLDNETRKGPHKLTGGINKDIMAIDAFMQKINILNDQSLTKPGTQVYLVGAPKFLIPAQEVINIKLRALAKRYPHVTYVNPAFNLAFQIGDNGKLGFDIHYSHKGYQVLNLHIMQAIAENYVVNRSAIKAATKLKQANQEIFYQVNAPLESDATKELCCNRFDSVLEEQLDCLETLEEDTSLYLGKMKEYVRENRAYDLYSLTKEIKPQQRITQLKNR